MGKKYVLDVLGEVCPVPLFKTKEKVTRELSSGDTLLVETDFPRAVRNIIDWSEKHGHHVKVIEIDEACWQVQVTKK
ncbi:MAG: sulfurtransferase TusA family protein [Thermoanaerobacteraceae bacterium]|nr:sulfurtransferase TusA family protein [Thermoanaerobacteraceae bacterium]